jgi:hypothetical protein
MVYELPSRPHPRAARTPRHRSQGYPDEVSSSRDCESDEFRAPLCREFTAAKAVPMHRGRSVERRGACADRPTRQPGCGDPGRLPSHDCASAMSPVGSPWNEVATWPLSPRLAGPCAGVRDGLLPGRSGVLVPRRRHGMLLRPALGVGWSLRRRERQLPATRKRAVRGAERLPAPSTARITAR